MDNNFQMLKEVDEVIRAFEAQRVRYALAGGFAVAIYGHVRATKDMDYLCHPEDIELATDVLVEQGYKSFAKPWCFQESKITLHRFMKPTGGEFFHVVDLLIPPQNCPEWIAQAQRVPWGDDAHINVVSKKHLVEMKRLRNSPMDQADITKLENDKS